MTNQKILLKQEKEFHKKKVKKDFLFFKIHAIIKMEDLWKK